MSAATAPALPKYGQQQSSSSAQSCTCPPTVALAVEQGATLSTKLTLTWTDPDTGVTSPVDITGATMQFTCKVDETHSDSDPTTIKIDWTETVTPTQGITYLVVPAATTQTMQAIAYVFQIRMKSSSGVVTPLLSGTLTVTVPISSRF